MINFADYFDVLLKLVRKDIYTAGSKSLSNFYSMEEKYDSY